MKTALLLWYWFYDNQLEIALHRSQTYNSSTAVNFEPSAWQISIPTHFRDARVQYLEQLQCRYGSKGNISGGARERRRREPLGGSGGMLAQKILKSRGLETLFPAFSKSYLGFTHIANYLLRTLSRQTNAHWFAPTIPLATPPGVKRGFIKGEAIRLLRTNYSERHFQETISNFKTRLKARGYPNNQIDGTLSEVKFSGRRSALRKQTKKTHEGIIPFVTTYHPALKNLKQLLMQEWSLIHNQPMLKNIYKTPPIISYRRGKSLKHAR